MFCPDGDSLSGDGGSLIDVESLSTLPIRFSQRAHNNHGRALIRIILDPECIPIPVHRLFRDVTDFTAGFF